MKDINDLTKEELVQIAIQENNAILEQQKEENEKGSKYIQNIYKKLTPEEEMQQLQDRTSRTHRIHRFRIRMICICRAIRIRLQ